jgi:hypothetical protein
MQEDDSVARVFTREEAEGLDDHWLGIFHNMSRRISGDQRDTAENRRLHAENELILARVLRSRNLPLT